MVPVPAAGDFEGSSPSSPPIYAPTKTKFMSAIEIVTASWSVPQLLANLNPAANKSKLFYLAQPYSHPQRYMLEARFAKVNQLVAILMRAGLFVFSPISHTHPPALIGGLPTGWEYWAAYDELMISRCDGLIVHMDEGWRTSRGVSDEISLAIKLSKPIYYLQDLANELETK